MIIFLQLLCIVALGLGLSRTWLDKPFYEDDGFWFYFAVFRDRGVRINSAYHAVQGHFGVQWIALQYARLCGDDSPRAFYALKAYWLAATSLVLYWTVYVYTGDTLAAFLGGLFFTLAWTTPNTLFMLTYAEHFFLLPLFVALGALRMGAVADQAAWYALAGLATAWTVQLKIINLPLLGLMALGLFWAPSPWSAAAAYFGAAVVQTLLPLLAAPRRSKGGHMYNALQVSYRTVAVYLDTLAKKRPAFRPLADRALGWCGMQAVHPDEYVAQMQRPNGQPLAQRLSQVMHGVRDLSPLLVLAAAGVATLPWAFEPVVLVALATSLFYLGLQQVQRNYFTPHFSPIWAGVALAAGMAAARTIERGAVDAPGMAVYVLLAAQAAWLARVQLRDREPGRRDMLGYLPPDKAYFLRCAEAVGQYVRDNSQPDEKMLVWGNHPSVYLYARRECVRIKYFFTYAHGTTVRHEDALFAVLQDAPPEWIVRYNNVVPERWDINNIAGRIGVQYDLVQRIQIKDPKGRVVRAYTGLLLDYPIYRRNDAHYLRMLNERAGAALDAGDAEACRVYVDRALKLAPEDVEARTLAGLLDAAPGERAGLLRTRLDGEKAPEAVAVLQRLLAAEMRRAGEVRACLPLLTKAMAKAPSDPAVMYAMGRTLVALGEVAKGAQMLNEVMRVHPHSPLVMLALADALIPLDQPEDASQLRRMAGRLVGNDPLLQRVLGAGAKGGEDDAGPDDGEAQEAAPAETATDPSPPAGDSGEEAQ